MGWVGLGVFWGVLGEEEEKYDGEGKGKDEGQRGEGGVKGNERKKVFPFQTHSLPSPFFLLFPPGSFHTNQLSSLVGFWDRGCEREEFFPVWCGFDARCNIPEGLWIRLVDRFAPGGGMIPFPASPPLLYLFYSELSLLAGVNI